MREIKFRAWDKTKKRITRVFAIGPYGDLHTWDGKIGGFSRTHGNRANSFKVMQFTGLLDCHGKEIYEGDIVRYDTKAEGYIPEYSEKAYEVSWNSKRAMFKLDVHWYGGEMIYKGYEVIGNIYENPELTQPHSQGK